MMAHAELAEAHGSEGIFALFHDRQSLARNRAPIFNAGRKASRSGLVPDAQSSVASQGANLVLGQAGIEKRSHDVVIGRCFLAGTEIVLVVQVDAISDGVEAARLTQFFHQREEFIFAKETALRIVADVL